MMLTAIDLFAGVGGIALGFKNNGVNIVYANDFDKYACQTYSTNFNHKIIEKDITKINTEEIPDVDLVLGGSPCQAFSIAGYQKGFEDERGSLFFDYLRIIKDKKPKAFFFENVKNLFSHNEGKTFTTMLEAFRQSGYYVKYKILNTCEYGNLPQNRERIYVIGFKDKSLSDKFTFPTPIPLTKKLTDLIDIHTKQDKQFYYNDTLYYDKMLKDTVIKKGTIYQIRRVYVRENKNSVCPTLTANMGMGGHNVPLIMDDFGIRKLTPRECFRLQGFPEDYRLPVGMANCHLYKQAGNSVSVPVVERIAKIIVKLLTDSES